MVWHDLVKCIKMVYQRCISIIVSLDERQLNCLVIIFTEDGSGLYQIIVLAVVVAFFVELLSEIELLSGVSLQFVFTGLVCQLGQLIVELVHSSLACKITNHFVPRIVVISSPQESVGVAKDDQALSGSAQGYIDSVSIPCFTQRSSFIGSHNREENMVLACALIPFHCRNTQPKLYFLRKFLLQTLNLRPVKSDNTHILELVALDLVDIEPDHLNLCLVEVTITITLMFGRNLLQKAMSDHEEWILTEEVFIADMFFAHILIVDFPLLVGDIADKIIDFLVHAELISQSKDVYFFVIPKDREESLFDNLLKCSARFELLLIANENEIVDSQLEDTVSVFKSGLACFIEDCQIWLEQLTLPLNLIDLSNQGSVSRDYISVAESHPHGLLVMLLPSRINKLDVSNLVEGNDDVEYVGVELSHSEQVDDELGVECIESQERLKCEVLFNGDQQVEVEETDLFFYDSLDNGLDLPVQNVDDFILFLWIFDHSPNFHNSLYVFQKLVMQKVIMIK